MPLLLLVGSSRFLMSCSGAVHAQAAAYLSEPDSPESPKVCFEQLADKQIGFQAAGDDHHPWLVDVRGPIAGVSWFHHGKKKVNSLMDCRLVLAIEEVSRVLMAPAGVVEVRHMSTFRPGARVRSTGKVSGHASALAVDLRYVIFDDGSRYDVKTDWVERTRGADPCATTDKELKAGMIRAWVCQSSAAHVFRVVVTPHHDDAHHNHVHLEVRPDVSWVWIR